MADMLSMPAYTEEMFQRGETSRTPGQSLFNPGTTGSPPSPEMIAQMQAQRRVDSPWLSDPTFNMQEWMPDGATTGDQWIRDAYAKHQAGEKGPKYSFFNPAPAQQARDPQYAGMPDDMYERMMADQQRTQAFQQQNPGMPMLRTMDVRDYEQYMNDQRQQLNSPSLMEIAQTNPFQPPPSVPIATQPPPTQQLVQQIQAPVTNMPTTPVPVPQAPPATQQLIKQIAAPTTPRAPAPMNQATQQFAQQFRPQPQPRPQPRPQPMAQPRRFQAQIRQPARSVSRVNPPLLPSRPTGRR